MSFNERLRTWQDIGRELAGEENYAKRVLLSSELDRALEEEKQRDRNRSDDLDDLDLDS